MAAVKFLILCLKVIASMFKSLCRRIWPTPPKDISGEIVLVTGAGHGMGRLEAIEFAKLGATVIVVDINQKGNEETARLIRENGDKAHSYTCDLSDKSNIERMANKVREEVGDVTILVNNAAVIKMGDIVSLKEEEIRRSFDVNILSHFWAIREFLPAMKKKNHGHIVSMASRAGMMGRAFITDYCATKYAVIGLCETLRRELRWMNIDGVHVTYVCPASVDTGFVINPSLQTSGLHTPQEVVGKLIEAVQHNKQTIMIPPSLRYSVAISSFLPDEAVEEIYDYKFKKDDVENMKNK